MQCKSVKIDRSHQFLNVKQGNRVRQRFRTGIKFERGQLDIHNINPLYVWEINYGIHENVCGKLPLCKFTQLEVGMVPVRGTESPKGQRWKMTRPELLRKRCHFVAGLTCFTVVMATTNTAQCGNAFHVATSCTYIFIFSHILKMWCEIQWLYPLRIHPQVQTELRRWLRKCRNQNHPTQAKRSITQITSRAREGFGQPPSSANISSVWHLERMTEWCGTVRDGSLCATKILTDYG